MRSSVELFLLAAFLFCVQAAFRRLGRRAALCCFLVLPALLTPYWLRVNSLGAFPWIKLYTVLASACWLSELRRPSPNRYLATRYGMSIILSVNILEAVILDLSQAVPAHRLHACSGALLLVLLRRGPHSVDVDVVRERRDLRFDGTTRSWIVGYTVWNAAFIQINYPEVAAHQVAVLSASLIVGLGDPARWSQARTYTLATDLILLATFYEPLLRTIHPTPQFPWSEMTCALVSFTVAVGAVAAHIAGHVRSRVAAVAASRDGTSPGAPGRPFSRFADARRRPQIART